MKNYTGKYVICKHFNFFFLFIYHHFFRSDQRSDYGYNEDSQNRRVRRGIYEDEDEESGSSYNNRRPFADPGRSNNYNRQGSFGGYRRPMNDINRMAGDSLQQPDWDRMDLAPFAKDFYTPHPNIINRSAEEVRVYLEDNEITISGNAPRPIQSFEEANFPDYVMDKVK